MVKVSTSNKQSGARRALCELFCLFVLVHVSCGDDSSSQVDDGGGGGTLQNVNHVIDYLHSLRRSQEEVFRKIDWLTKVVEDKDREEHKFRLKFSRKVHTLENKLLHLEQTLALKVEEIVQRKINEQLRSPRFRPARGSSSGSHDDADNLHHDADDDDLDGVQNHQPYPSSQQYNLRYHHPQQQYSPYHHIRHEPVYQNNWGFYEHPITHKKVRDGNLFKYEPPTRDLPLISLVATTSTSAQLQAGPDVKGASSSSVTSTATPSAATAGGSQVGSETDGTQTQLVPTQFVQKKFESFESALKQLRENVSNLEREILREGSQNDRGDVHNVLVENSKEIMSLHQKHQDMLRRIEHFTVEMEKAAAKREHAMNESMREIGLDLKKQIGSVKAYTKRQIQNLTITNNNQAGPDRSRCAQTLLDELMSQMNKPKSRYPVSTSSLVQSDLIADQAESDDDEEGMGKLTQYSGRRSARAEIVQTLEKELELQRKEILELKSEIARLNISQILLMRTVDEETLKRTVRPRDCSEIRLLRNVSSGVFSVFPWMNDLSIDVYCDMQTDGGGWTVVQRRGVPLEGDVQRESFFRGWSEYEEGFGELNMDFWLGLSNIAALCQLGIQELRIEMTNWSGESRFANYQYFKISNALDKYRLSVSSYSGTAGDSMQRHNGMAFSTPDSDNDADPRRHCAKTYFSGWWYYACFESNLNGIYVNESEKNGTRAFGTGIIWQHWMGHYSSLKSVEMKIRNTFIGESHYLHRLI